jgi:hypothetical protein
MSDEPLLAAGNPIGVRLRYRVAYPLGLDLDRDHGAFAQVRANHAPDLFTMLHSSVTPRVSHAFPAGTYEIIEDFVPAFLPPTLYATTPP